MKDYDISAVNPVRVHTSEHNSEQHNGICSRGKQPSDSKYRQYTLPVGFWLGLWDTEHGALELYRMLRRRLPEGETARTVDELIKDQRQQIQLTRELYTITMAGATEFKTPPDITVEIPPAKVPWKAHQPPTDQEIAWSALDYERRELFGYESIESILSAGPLHDKAKTLLVIQRKQIQTLLDLAGEPPR